VAVVQVLRLALQWDVVIGGWHLPLWASIVAVLVAGFMSFSGFRLYQGHKVSMF
jgi:hypothetical protein